MKESNSMFRKVPGQNDANGLLILSRIIDFHV